MQSSFNREQMYLVRKGTQLLAWGFRVEHALVHQKESSGQEQGHTLAVLCLPETPMSVSAIFAVILIVP